MSLTIEDGLDNLLRTDAAINAIIQQRAFPDKLPEQVAYPALTYSILVGTGTRTLTDPGLQKWRIQVDCWGTTYADAKNLRAAVMKELNGYSGILSDGTFLQLMELIGPIFLPYDTAALTYRCPCEFYLYFNFPASA